MFQESKGECGNVLKKIFKKCKGSLESNTRLSLTHTTYPWVTRKKSIYSY